jgi:porin
MEGLQAFDQGTTALSWAVAAELPLLAQAATPDGNPAPQGANSAQGPGAVSSASSDSAAGDWPTLNQLLALPPWMDLTLTVTAAPITNAFGGLTSAANWMQQNELNLTLGSGLALDPSKWREIDHWQARVRVDYYNGSADYGDVIGSFFAPQTLAITPGFYLSGLSLQRTSRDQSLRISAGFQSMDQDFLVNPSYLSYLYSGFNDTLNLTLPGLPITPFVAPSVVVHWQTPGFGTWSLGGYWLDQETEMATLLSAPSSTSADLKGSLQIIQWDLPLWTRNAAMQAPIVISKERGVARMLPSPLLQLGAFNSSVDFSSVADSPTGANVLVNRVIYGSLTVPVTLPLGLDNRLWAGANWGFDVSQNPTPLFLQGGWLCQGLIPGRPLDVLALGIGRSGFSAVLLPQLSGTTPVELNYNIRINSRLSVQPVLQWFINPSGDGQVPGILTTALQIAINF